ncbi:MAG: transposase [Acidobacteria bacterium]|nr:transposase [Acidobacteriota bacterium]
MRRKTAPSAPKSLVREHRCINCGFVAHRDHNAAINIQKRAKAGHGFGDGLRSPCEPRRILHYSRSSGLVGEVSICRDKKSEIQGQKNSRAIPVANERPRQVTVR